MSTPLEPSRRFKCTYENCDLSFKTEKAMKTHKKNDDEHDYCPECDEDFHSYDTYVKHKITRPEQHDKACRICGDEFKSNSGLKRHIELNHKLDQILTCVGCQKSYTSASDFLRHIETGECEVISPQQFHAQVVHKHLITELLKQGPVLDRFNLKTSKYGANQDYEEEGGVSLSEDPLDDNSGVENVEFPAMEPVAAPGTPIFTGHYPPLPSQATSNADAGSVTSVFDNLSLTGNSAASTVVGSPVPDPVLTLGTGLDHAGSTFAGSSVASTDHQVKVWGKRKGKTASKALFPDAKPTPAPSEFSIAAYDQTQQESGGLNIMRDHFWDPQSADFNPEAFFNPVIGRYHCPFDCVQVHLSTSDLATHILGDHRITRIKCPTCLKYYNRASDLLMHCEARGSKCQVNKAKDFAIFLDVVSGGFLGVVDKVRPDHLHNPAVMLRDPETGRMERYRPPTASYLQYTVTKPPDWKEPVRAAAQIGGMPGVVVRSQW
ncbi:hypothetical protein ACN47E_002531 [Coniothyrium glycines]